MPYKGTDPERLAANRQYRRNHYYAFPEPYKERAKQRNKEIKEMVDKLKSEPCTDCGASFPPYVMDFDHRDPSQKSDIVSRMVRRAVAVKTILDEIAKCDLVCANCHRERTFGLPNIGAGTPRGL